VDNHLRKQLRLEEEMDMDMDTDIKTTPTDAPAGAPTPRIVELVLNNRRNVAYGLFGAAAVLAVLVLLGAFSWYPEYSYRLLGWGVATFAVLAGFGVILLLEPDQREQPRIWALQRVLLLGTLLGLAVTAAGVLIAQIWWGDVLAMLGRGTPDAGAWWRALLVVVVIFAGLGLMFGSLQLGRSEERHNPSLRRALYGYNAILTALLLVIIVAVVNVIIAVKVPAPLDFTKSRHYTLAPQSLGILNNLEMPVEITFIPGFDDGLVEDEMRTLLANVQGATDKIAVRELSPMQDQQRTRELAAKYPNLTRGCLLLTFQKGEQTDHRVITEKEMVQAPEPMMMQRGAPPEHKFIGEDALMTVLAGLSDDKAMPIVYFLQGHNELDINDAAPQEAATGAGILKRRLEAKRRLEVKPLTFDLGAPAVPRDADLIVIAGPRRTIPPNEVNALREYSNRGGRLLVMADPVIVNGKMVPTGLEELLAEMGVGLPPERIITVVPPNVRLDVTDVRAVINPQLVPVNVLAREFRDQPFAFEDARPLQVNADPHAGGRFQTQQLMLSVTPSYAESKLDVDPTQLVEALFKNAKELEAKRREMRNIPLVALVTDSGPSIPGHPPMGESKPRAVVFGSAGFAANRNIDERASRPNFPFLSSCIEWLVRDEKAIVGIPPIVRQGWNLMPRSGTEELRIVFLPPVLVLMSVVGLAAGVWVVRRR